MIYTTILYPVRKQFGISNNEFAVADVIRMWSCNPASPVPGWCNASRETIAEACMMTRQTVITIIKTLAEKGLIDAPEDTKLLRSTALFYNAVTGCKESLQGVKNLDSKRQAACKDSLQGVKNLDSLDADSLSNNFTAGCKESLQTGVKNLDTISNTYNNTDNKEKKEVADSEESAFLDAVVIDDSQNKKKAKTPKVAPKGSEESNTEATEVKEPKIVNLIRHYLEDTFEGYYWDAKNGVAAKQIATKLKNAIDSRRKTDATDPKTGVVGNYQPCNVEDVHNAFKVLVERSKELTAYYQFSDLTTFNSRFNDTIIKVRQLPKSPTSGTHTKRTGPVNGQANVGSQLDDLSKQFFGY